MKRFISAFALCISLLVLLSLFLFPPVHAKENVLLKLLDFPAPPPPNPLSRGGARNRNPKFYDRNNPPKDDAPIAEILDYWARQENGRSDYGPEPSEKVFERIRSEVAKNPVLLSRYLNILERDPKAPDLVKEIYDRETSGEVFDRSERKTLKSWLTYHSSYFSGELERLAANVADTDEYVTNQDELLALAKVDFDKASPILDRLNADSSLKTSRVVAKWALYRHALATNSIDIDQYRDELKAIVEDKRAIAGMRDMAMDALVHEKEWAGRDDWYFSLLGDETLADLKVNGRSYTGLTTLMLVSPDDKYVGKMVELVHSPNPVVRNAAVRNLVTRIENGGPEVVRALLPWLDDPKWAVDTSDAGGYAGPRNALVRKLIDYEIPESVPGLIKILDEKQTRPSPNYGSMANAANMAANRAYRIANTMRPASNYSDSDDPPVVVYPHRNGAISALGKQKDIRAVPALSRVISEIDAYQRGSVVKAILDCGGYSVAEQMDALEAVAKDVRKGVAGIRPELTDSLSANIANTYGYESGKRVIQQKPVTAAEIRALLGQQLMQSSEISDELARAIVDRIEALDGKDATLAGAYRRMILKWQNAAINTLLLRDVKLDAADADTIVRLLSQRKELREKQSNDVFDLRTGKPSAIGLAACMIEDPTDYATVLTNADTETKTAMLACSRLIRASLPVAKVAENLRSPDQTLQIAAERYLEAEDSPEARGIILTRHPNEAKILGATTAFFVEGARQQYYEYLWMLYLSVGDNSLYNGWVGSGNDDDLKATEKSLQAEVKKDDDLLGVYAYDGNYIRIYKDRVIFSWDEDESRYRERPLTKYEFDEIRSYLTTNKVDELPPFLACGEDDCAAKELLMLGRAGGRRVYSYGGAEAGSEFFAGLDKYFADLKQTRATLKYTLSREVPGLEILLASDDLHAETVWEEGSDIRVAASIPSVRKKVKADIEEIEPDSDQTNEDSEGPQNQAKLISLIEKRRFEGYAWYKIANGDIAGNAVQPPQVEFIPVHDSLPVQPGEEQWKARASGIEIRASREGLFKVAGGKLTRIGKGAYEHIVVTPNGRWALASKSDEETGDKVVRVDLLTSREYPVAIKDDGQKYPVAYIPTLNKVLVVRNERYESERNYFDGEEDSVPSDADPATMLLVDPATGVTQSVAGEFRPLAQQTFRSLQKTSRPNEFWAAVPDTEKNETDVGIYDARLFGFKPVLRIPKIKFNSMSMWVDETAGKVFFVYRGHLLALPLGNNRTT